MEARAVCSYSTNISIRILKIQVFKESIDELTTFIKEKNINFNHISEKYDDCKQANIDLFKVHCKIFEMKSIQKDVYKSILDVILKYEAENK